MVESGNQHGRPVCFGGGNSGDPPHAGAQSDLAAPGAVASVTLTRGDGTVTATWPAADHATSYHVTYTTNGGTSWQLAALNHPATRDKNTITISDADNDATYIVGVRARNNIGSSNWVNSPAAGPYTPPTVKPKPKPTPTPEPTPVPVPPAAPSGVTAESGHRSVVLSWDNPSDPSLTGYELQMRAAPPAPGWGPWTKIAGSDASTTSHTVSGLRNGTEYRFKVRAVNADGASKPAPNASPWFVAATPQAVPVGLPGVPELDGARGQGWLPVRWAAATGSDVVYDLAYSGDGGQTWTQAATGIIETSYVITGVDDEVAYIVAVRARNSDGAHAYGAGAVGGADVAALGGASAATGLGQGQWVYSATINPPPGRPGYPFIQRLGREDGTLPVLWKVSDTPGVTYDVVYSADGMRSWERAATGITPPGCTHEQSGGHNWRNSVCYTIKGPEGSATGVLDNLTTYVVSVRAKKSGEVSQWVNSEPFDSIARRARVDVDVLGCSGSTNYVLQISWPVLPEQHTVDVGYKIGDGAWVDLPVETADHLWHLHTSKGWVSWPDQLPAAASSYDVEARVRYKKTLGSDDIVGEWGTTTSTAGTSADVVRWMTRCPGAPTGLAVSASTSTSATVGWNAVTGGNDYDIRHKVTTDADWGPITVLASPSYGNHVTSHTITGLDNTKTYTIAVRAREWHEAGTSDWVTVTTTLPGLTATGIAATTANLGLSGHTGNWWHQQTAPNSGACTGPVSGDRTTLSSLSGATAYTWAAYSKAGCDSADKMDDVTFTTLDSLTASKFTGTGATLTLASATTTWYYQANTGPDSTCQGPVITSTEALTGLTVGTLYVYTAYSDSSCTSANQLGAALTFTAAVTVSNLAGTDYGPIHVGNSSNSTRDAAQAFTTGSSSGGYTLSSITIDSNGKTGSPTNIAVTLHAAASGNAANPASASLATLSGQNPDSSGEHSYECSGSGCTLSANTTYFVVLKASNSPNDGYYALPLGRAADVKAPSSNGWSIADAGRVQLNSSWSNAGASNEAYRIKVTAVPNPSLSASSENGTTATLTLSGPTGSWWLKRTTPSGGTCTAGEADYSHALSNLTAGTAYTYRAYADSGCAVRLAVVSFTTPELEASSITATGATLTLNDYFADGQTVSWWYARSAPVSGGCQGPSSSTSVTLTDLSAATLYAYTAYSKANCNAADLVDWVGFWTPGTLTATNITPTGATLTLASRSSTWYYKADTGPHSSCQGPVSTTTQALTGLTTNATYTYSAYSSAGCSDTNLIATAAAFTMPDYDADNDRLIEIRTVAQLNAIRWDADGNGQVTGSNQSNYRSAFPGATYTGNTAMGCPSTCQGYELVADLDFDEDGDGNRDDTYNTGSGWAPIGNFTTTLKGNRHSVRNLYVSNSISTTGDHLVGMFSALKSGAVIDGLVLRGADVAGTVQQYSYTMGTPWVGAVAGKLESGATIRNVSVTGAVLAQTVNNTGNDNDTNRYAIAGGIAGQSQGAIERTHSGATVRATISVGANGGDAGGIAGHHRGSIVESYFTGTVEGTARLYGRVGGIAGVQNGGSTKASYSVGRVSARPTTSTGASVYAGGIVGNLTSGTVEAVYAAGSVTASGNGTLRRGGITASSAGGTITNSYYDSTVMGTLGGRGTAKTTSELQTPTGYTGIYANWNLNLDGVTGGDNPWAFGTASQYPALRSAPVALAVSAVTGTTATLTLIGHNGAWWYQGSQAGASCTSVTAGTSTVSLASLTPGTAHTYRAYSAAGCSSANQLGTAPPFTTTGLSASTIAGTTATLTIVGHSGTWYVKQTAPNTGTCSSAISGATTSLASLAEATTHTYKAYSDSGCSTEIASATFTTHGLSVTAGAYATALSLVGHSGTWYVKQTAPTNGTCSSAINEGSTTQIRNLAQGTTYTYVAYSDSGCTTQVATATFTTKGLTASAVTATSATLTIHGHTVNWRVKETSPNTGTCSSAISATTHDLSSLTPNTTYSYTAYSGFSCFGQIGDVTFTTLSHSLEASAVTETTATLTIAGQTGNWYAKETSPNTGTCSSAISATTHSLSSLTADTSYTYKAYSDSGCNTELASATFTTLDLSASAIKETTATLTLSNRSGDWYVKKTAPGTGTCSSAISATTHSLSSLTAGTSHTYKAYSDSGCSTEIASVTFTTLGLSASAISASGATLTIAGHAGNWYAKQTSPSNGTCSSAISTTTHNLSSLSPGTSYTYKAYSDSACTSSNLLATATFKTKPRLTASAVTRATATLTITGHTGNWYAKKTSPGSGTCSSAISGATHSLSSLTPGTPYTYTAYSDSGCTTVLASASFTTVGLDAHAIGATTARLDITGHTGNWYVKKTSPGSGTCSSAISSGSHNLSSLTPGTSYTYSAYSDSACTSANLLDTVTFKTTAQVSASAITNTTAKLTITGHTGNWYVKKTSPGSGSCSSVITGTETDLSSLNAGTSYTYTAYTNSGCSALNDITSVTFTTTQAVTASSVTNTTATISIVGRSGNWYWRQISPTKGSCSSVITGEATNLTGLTAGTTYGFAAFSDAACTSYTDNPNYRAIGNVIFTTTKVFTAEYISPTTATLSFPGLPGAWYVKKTAPTTGTCSSAISGEATNLSSLTHSTSYTYTAYSNSGCTTQHGTVTFTTPAVLLVSPGLPTGFSGMYQSGSLNLKWTRPTHMTNDAFWYQVECSTNDGTSYTSCKNVPATASTNLTATISNTGVNKVRVRSGGTGYAVSGWVTADVPGLTASAVTGTTATVTLTGRTGNWWIKRTAPTNGTCTAGEADYSHALSSLTSGTTYTYTAYTNSTCGTEMAAVTFDVVAAPTNVGAQYQDGSLKMWWKRPTGVTGAVSYRVDCSDNNGVVWSSPCLTKSATSDTDITVTITNQNVNRVCVLMIQNGLNSTCVQSAVPSGTVPGAPTSVCQGNIQFLGGGQYRKTMTWTKPSSPAGAVGYHVEINPSTVGNNWKLRKTIAATTNTNLSTNYTTNAADISQQLRVRSVVDGLVSAWVVHKVGQSC